MKFMSILTIAAGITASSHIYSVGQPIAQQAYVKASNTGYLDTFAYSVAISGDTMVVGAPGEDSNATGVNGNQNNEGAQFSGAAYIFVRNGTNWVQQAYLKASNTGAYVPGPGGQLGDAFGWSVAISGDTVVVGALQEASAATGVNGEQDNDDLPNAGAAYVFVRNGTNWTQQAYLKAHDHVFQGAAEFGNAVAISGNTIVVGAHFESSAATGINNPAIPYSPTSGAAYIFVRIGTNWSHQAYLKASNAMPTDEFGISVAVSGDIVVVGASYEDSNATGINGNQNDNSAEDAGAAYIFARTGTNWTQQAYVKASNAEHFDYFGESVAVSGQTVVIGAYRESSNATGVNGDDSNNSVSQAGAAYVFVRSGTTWSQQAYLKPFNPHGGQHFGISVAMSGEIVVVGANQESSDAIGVNGTPNDYFEQHSGAAYVFFRVGSTWSQQAYLKPFNTEAYDYFGSSVAVSVGTTVVGSPREDSTSTGVNSTPTGFDNQFESGAAYVFAGLGAPEIVVEQQLGIGLIDGTATVNFGSGLMESSSARTFTVRNLGTADLTGLGVTIDGANAADFAVTLNPTAPVIPGGSTIFAVTFSPSSPGAKTATLHLASNDADENPFDITLIGEGLSLLDVAQQAYVKSSNTDAGDNFGYSVALLGDIVVIGAPFEDSDAAGVNGDQANDAATDSGAAYIFVRNGATWQQQAYLKAFNPDPGDSFGYSVAISSNVVGPTVVVGAIGESSADGNPSDNSATNAGAAYVFARIGINWSQQAYLKASNPGAEDWFGHSLSISGDTLVVGAILEDSNATGINGNQADNSALDAGAAYVFVRSGATWTQQAYLKASDVDPDDRFGRSVGISGNTVVVGVPRDDSASAGVNGNPNNNSLRDAGAAYIFERGGTRWLQRAYLKASNPGMDDRFGYDVAISGNTAVVSAVFEDSDATGVNGDQSNNDVPQAGAAYVFVRNGTTWSQQAYLKASNPGTGDQFGAALSVTGDIIGVGAILEDSGATGINGDQSDNSRGGAGAAYIFVRSGTSWAQQAYLKASNTGASDQFGTSVSVSADTIVVGAPLEDSNATGINGIQNNNAAADSGAAYIFTGFCPGPELVIVRDGASGYFIRALGGCTHRLQRAPSLTGPWSNLGTISSADEFHDTLPLPGQAFYRTVQP